jgi:hypothetical protein
VTASTTPRGRGVKLSLGALAAHCSSAFQPVAVRLRISDVHDAVRRSETGSLAPAQFANHRTANVRLPLAAGELPPGQYLLTFEASAGDLRAERLVRFEMRWSQVLRPRGQGPAWQADRSPC